MIIPHVTALSDEQLKEVTDILTAYGCKVMVIKGAERSVYAIVGDERNDDMVTKIEGLHTSTAWTASRARTSSWTSAPTSLRIA